MKNSGIEWIGNIPDGWELQKIKFCAINKREKTTTLNLPYIALENVESFSSKLIEIENAYNVNDAIEVKTGDVIFGKLRPYLAKVYLVEKSACVSSEFAVFQPTSISNRYLKYYMLSYGFLDTVNASTYGAKMPRANVDFLRNTLIPVFDIAEQQQIAEYLDEKCGKIDFLIDNIQMQIEKLKEYKQSVITEAVTKGLDKTAPMKDSGIDWLGKIPENWNVGKLKNICKLFGRIGFRGYTQDDLVDEGNGAITLSPSNMKGMKMSYFKCAYLSWEKYEESPEIKISNGDILFVKTGSTFGKVAIVENLPMEATINPQLVVIKDIKANNKFLVYFLSTYYVHSQVDCSVVGGTIPTISQEKILNYSIIVPPISEQQQIAEYLDKKCAKIDKLIAIKQQKIERLQEYKKSLIYEYVTGKKEVV